MTDARPSFDRAIPPQDGAPEGKRPRVTCDIDFDAPGKHHGYLTVPHSRNESAWGSVTVPVTVVNGAPGPTVLFTGGSHGDEYEGPIALLKLATALEPRELAGRVIILPVMNLPAVRTATRVSPVDGVNMNRAFPGRRDGGVTEMIAHFVATEIVPRADVVVDLHAGGKTLDFVPSAVMHELDDRRLMRDTLAALRAFGAPLGMVLRELDSEGMLDTLAEDMGKIFLSTELGGRGTVTRETVAIAERGVANILRHFGLLEGALDVPPPEGPAQATRLMHTPDADCFVTCRHAGIYEPLVDLGEPVTAGQPIANIHPFEDSGAAPAVYHAKRDGLLYCRHAPGLIGRGDCLAVIAADYPLPDPDCGTGGP